MFEAGPRGARVTRWNLEFADHALHNAVTDNAYTQGGHCRKQSARSGFKGNDVISGSGESRSGARDETQREVFVQFVHTGFVFTCFIRFAKLAARRLSFL